MPVFSNHIILVFLPKTISEINKIFWVYYSTQNLMSKTTEYTFVHFIQNKCIVAFNWYKYLLIW